MSVAHNSDNLTTSGPRIGKSYKVKLGLSSYLTVYIFSKRTLIKLEVYKAQINSA